jgi:glycosyltransferase involved in cell wall biosynthesis
MAKTVKISVILCTHNPRRDYLSQTLDHLRVQTLPVDQWELLIVDNGSSAALSEWLDISWHSRSCIVREETLGLTNARLRGIAESVGEIIVFVDDDNLLAPDYLQHATDIAAARPYIGAFGGAIIPRFEQTVNPALAVYYPYLALREVPRDQWGNMYGMNSTPYGAGLVVRREVATRYTTELRSDPVRRALGRTGNSLISCEDVDLAWTSIDIGFGIGVFRTLSLTHIIPAARMQKDYLLRMVEAITASHVILDNRRNITISPPKASAIGRLVEQLRLLRKTKTERAFARAKTRGYSLGWRLIAQQRGQSAGE